MDGIKKAGKTDLPEILDLQYKAFSTVAIRMETNDLPPLKQTLEELEEEFGNGVILKYVLSDRIVGSVRGNFMPDSPGAGQLYNNDTGVSGALLTDSLRPENNCERCGEGPGPVRLCYVGKLIVDPEFRSRGIGAALMANI